MEKGDLGTWVQESIVVVLEGPLALIPPPEVEKTITRKVKSTTWAPADEWGWSVYAIKQINDKAYRFNMSIDVVTFLAPEVADMAADWLAKYEVAVAEVSYSEFDVFCESLKWRQTVHTVVDTEPDRLDRYGVKGFQTVWGGDF